jgi:predicted lipoprotein with Yx(FWY)xxD motif
MRKIRLLACALGLAMLAGCAESDTSDARRIAESADPGEVAPIDATDGRRQSTARVLPDDAPSPEATANPAGTITMVPGPPVHLTDAAGASVYMLEGNANGDRCDAICEEAWPPVVAQINRPQPGPGVDGNLLGTAPRPDGSLQVRYGTNPLYRYAGDRGAGRTSGHQVTDKWGLWTLVGLDGNPVQDQLPDSAERPAATDTQQTRQQQGSQG